MSYEGYVEYLCDSGHYDTRDCHDVDPKTCEVCGRPIAYWHSVDQTNGRVNSDPSTYPAPKALIDMTDVWHHDHYGNKYAERIPQFTPLQHWREMK